MTRLLPIALRGWSEYRRLWWKQWRSPYKRGNKFLVPPLRERLTMACRMAGCGRMIVLGPPYRAPRWMRHIGCFLPLAPVLWSVAANAGDVIQSDLGVPPSSLCITFMAPPGQTMMTLCGAKDGMPATLTISAKVKPEASARAFWSALARIAKQNHVVLNRETSK